MTDTDIRSSLTSALAGVTLGDAPEDVMRRGNRIRRGRRAGRTALVVVVGLTAAGLAASALAPPRDAARLELVAYSLPSLPVSLDPVPDGMAVTFDVDMGRLLALYADPSTSEDRLSLRVDSAEPDADDATVEEQAEVRGKPARLVVRDRPGTSEDRARVTWQAGPDTWVSLSGRGRFSTADELLGQAQNVVDEPLPMEVAIGFAPSGWTLVGYKSLGAGGSVLALADGEETGADARRLTVAHQPGGHGPIEPARMEDPGPVTPITVSGRPGQLVEGARGWYATWPSPDGGHLVLQAPKDLSRDQVLVMAEGISVG